MRAPEQVQPFLLHDPRITELDRLLNMRAVPFDGMDVEMLDGFATALVLGPEAPPPETWFSEIWGKTEPRWENAAERDEALALVEALWATVQRRICFDADQLPNELMPIWWLPDDPLAEHPDDTAIGTTWAAGFLEGMDRYRETWDAWIANAEWIEEAEAIIESIAVGSFPGETEDAPEQPIPYQERLALYASLPDMLNDLQQYRIDALTPREPLRVVAAPGRNDPCSCGSGRKFKKCCGASG